MGLPEIPGYDVESEIADGGMGVVYRARHLALDRTVALKVIHPRYLQDEEFVKGFAQEARTIARLSHPNIVSIYDFGCSEGIYYLSMAYVQGSTLRDLLFVRQPKCEEWIAVVKQVAEALDYAHKEKVVHRDIKPGNILLCANGKSMVIDFGVAHASYSEAAGSVWLAAGTRAYMSPEQCREQPASPRSDQYSLGVVVYELLTGRLPFAAADPRALMQQHISDVPPPLRTGRTDITPRIEAAVLRALSKVPEMRFQSVGAFARELEAALREVQSLEDPIRPAAASATSKPREGLRDAPVSLVDGTPAAPTPTRNRRIGYLNAVRSVSGKGSRSFGVTLLLILVLTIAGAGGYFAYLNLTTARTAETARIVAEEAAKSFAASVSERSGEKQARRRNRRSNKQNSAVSAPTSSTPNAPGSITTVVEDAKPAGDSEKKSEESTPTDDGQETKTPDSSESDSDKAAKE